MAQQKKLSGINIQFPISQLIVEGRKVVETRTYPIPAKYINQEMVLVETPGKKGKFKARMIAIVKFGESFRYENRKQFYADSGRHCVTPESVWAWTDSKGKWGWPVTVVKVFKTPISPKKRTGIQYTTGLRIPG